MTAHKPKTTAQLKRIFGLVKKARLPFDKDQQSGAAVAASHGRVDRLSLLTFDEANRLITTLGGEPLSFTTTPRRTRNYRNQQAGIQMIASAAQQQKLEDLWFAVYGRTPQGLETLCERTIKSPRPRTALEAGKMIEAVKSMNRRAAAPTEVEPTFRRVA